MVSLDKFSGSYNVLFLKSCVPKKTKDINVKAFNMITNKNEAETRTKHISCDCKCKFNSTTGNSYQKWNNETCQYACKNYCTCKRDSSWDPTTCICKNDKCFKMISDDLKIVCDEIISVVDILSTKMIYTIATNVTKNCHSKKVKYNVDFYIAHSFISDYIAIDKYYYLLPLCKTSVKRKRH